MLFSSSTFILFFLPAVLIIYYGILRNNRKLQNVFLLLSSLLFYAWGEPLFVLVMILSIIANWFFGLAVYKCQDDEKTDRVKLWVALSVVFNLGILFVFKYLTFALETVEQIVGRWSFEMQIALPIGISFFTFQGMSYVIDVYRGKGGVLHNVLDVGLYISFFPQLIAGPIVRYETVAYEILNRRETREDFFEGFSRFIIGVGKKVLLANVFAVFADNAFADVSALTVGMSWVGALSYAFQIFFDFSGYSDMAIGLGRMFGFHFLENFDYPYVSKSVSEFWRKWHISLGTWFRDYVYIPLGGSRVTKNRLIFNLFVVWMLTGIWHGANWTFFAWGFMYFVLLSIEKLTGFDKAEISAGGKILGWVYTMLFVLLGWVVFRADSLKQAFLYIKTMFGFTENGFLDFAHAYNKIYFLIYLSIAVLFSTPIAKKISVKYGNRCIVGIFRVVYIVSIFLLSMASLLSNTHNPFIYFNF